MPQLTSQQEEFKRVLLQFRAERRKAPLKDAAAAVGYSYQYARQLVTEPNIRADLMRLEAEMNEAATERCIVTKEEIINEYRRLALVDVGRLYNDDGTLKRVHELDEDTRRALVGIKVTNTRDGGPMVEYKLEKKGALDSLSRTMGMFNDKMQLGVTFKDILDDVAKMGGSSEPLVCDEDDDENYDDE